MPVCVKVLLWQTRTLPMRGHAPYGVMIDHLMAHETGVHLASVSCYAFHLVP